MALHGRWYKVVAFIISAVGMGILSVVASFNVYANAMKTRFNYTQTGVEMLASLGVLGQFFGIPAGMLFHSYGPRATSLVGLVLGLAGYLLLYMSIRLSHIFQAYNFVVSIFFLIANHSLSYTYLGFLLTNMEMFSDVHRGKIVVALNTLFQAPFWPFIYNFAFLGEDIEYQSEDNIEGFFLSLAIAFAIVNTSGLVILRKKPTNENRKEIEKGENEQSLKFMSGGKDEAGGNVNGKQVSTKQSKGIFDCLRRKKQHKRSTYLDDTHETTFVEGHENESDRMHMQPSDEDVVQEEKMSTPLLPLLAIFKKPGFQFAAWVAVLSFCVNITYLTNLTAVMNSVELSHWFSLIIISCPLIGLFISFVICNVSSVFAQRLRPSIIALVLTSLQAASQILLIFFMDSMPALFVCSCVEIGAALTVFSLIPTILAKELGPDNFNRVWGYVLLMLSIAVMIFQNSYGAIYESKITDHGTHCSGKSCVTDCFLMLSILCGTAVLLNVGLVEIGW